MQIVEGITRLGVIELELKDIAEKYVRSMVKHDFMHGWMGDTSEEFIQGQIDILVSDPKRCRIGIANSISNLVQYCKWSRKEVEELADAFGFKIVDAPGLVAGVTGEVDVPERKCKYCGKVVKGNLGMALCDICGTAYFEGLADGIMRQQQHVIHALGLKPETMEKFDGAAIIKDEKDRTRKIYGC